MTTIIHGVANGVALGEAVAVATGMEVVGSAGAGVVAGAVVEAVVEDVVVPQAIRNSLVGGATARSMRLEIVPWLLPVSHRLKDRDSTRSAINKVMLMVRANEVRAKHPFVIVVLTTQKGI